MSEQDMTKEPTGRSVKTLAIRLDPDTHAQLSLIAQLRGKTITDEIRTALEVHLAAARTTPELADHADAVLAAIQAEADARTAAISALFGTASATGGTDPAPPASSRSRGSRAGGSRG